MPLVKTGAFLLFFVFSLNWAASLTSKKQDEVLGLSSDVTVQASIGMTPIIWVSPQNRILPTGNDSLQIDVKVRQPGTLIEVYTENLIVNDQGFEKMMPLTLSQVPIGQYDVAVKGLSHLNRVYPNQTFGPTAEFMLDLRYLDLLAGDSHPTADNYVNSLDISYEILHLYSNDLRADLNRDSKVNSLEFPTLISNLYSHGDI